MDHVDFEVLAVVNDQLAVRYRINDKHVDAIIPWDGTGDVLETLKLNARSVLRRLKQPPPPSFALLQQQVGKLGHVDIDETPIASPTQPPPPPPTP